MDRSARNLDDLCSTGRTLTGQGVRVEFVKEQRTPNGGGDSALATMLLRTALGCPLATSRHPGVYPTRSPQHYGPATAWLDMPDRRSLAPVHPEFVMNRLESGDNLARREFLSILVEDTARDRRRVIGPAPNSAAADSLIQSGADRPILIAVINYSMPARSAADVVWDLTVG